MHAIILSLLLALPGAAMAHVGHVAEVAGHTHWVAGAAIGLAVLVGLWGKHKDKSAAKDEAEEAEPEEEQHA